MTRIEAAGLAMDDRVTRDGDLTDLGTVTATGWNSVEITWDDGEICRMHFDYDDYARLGKAACAGEAPGSELHPSIRAIRWEADGD